VGPNCKATTCSPEGGTYCGVIGDGCGETLDCGSACPKAGWTCEDNVCVGGPSVCTKATCTTATGDHYCGVIGDGCGGALDCGDSCPTGWQCQDHVCVGPASVCTKTTCETASGDHYCGIIGDRCGGSLDCGSACPKADWTCNQGLCQGAPSVCTPKTCTTAGGDQYCGTVGDGCGHSLDCGTCSKSRWVCDDGLCKGPPSVCTPASCSPDGAQYCGVIGDGCGSSKDCGSTCTNAGWTCGDKHVCVGGEGCTKSSCNTDAGQVYCGTIGDNCGGSIDCPSTCPGNATCGSSARNVCGDGHGCTNLCLQRVRCDAGTTSLSGTVYDPAGKVPLYNVLVYIPNGTLDPIVNGASCDKCGGRVSGDPLAVALTDVNGHFQLDDVPVGSAIPLVMQVGKWRRQVFISSIMACTNNVISDPGPPHQLLRLPRNQSEGSMPQIMLTTGGADTLECFLRRIGIDDGEFTLEASRGGTGRVHMFRGGVTSSENYGGTSRFASPSSHPVFTAAQDASVGPSFWDDLSLLKQYDVIVHSCEGAGYARNKSAQAFQSMADYVNAGGRIFASHYHHAWFEYGPSPLPSVANWCTKDCGGISSPATAYLDTSFPKGKALADWMVNVGGSPTRGEFQEDGASFSVKSVNSTATRWIYMNDGSNNPHSVQFMSFNTPVDAAAADQCGRAVVSDLHVGAVPSGVAADTHADFPDGCQARDLTPQEKALEFLFFDLSACVQSDTVTPTPPAPAPAAPAPPPPPPAAAAAPAAAPPPAPAASPPPAAPAPAPAPPPIVR
jgi:hypothetical protein